MGNLFLKIYQTIILMHSLLCLLLLDVTMCSEVRIMILMLMEYMTFNAPFLLLFAPSALFFVVNNRYWILSPILWCIFITLYLVFFFFFASHYCIFYAHQFLSLISFCNLMACHWMVPSLLNVCCIT